MRWLQLRRPMLLVLAALASAATGTSDDEVCSSETFQSRFSRRYPDENTRRRRAQTFAANVAHIRAHNALADSGPTGSGSLTSRT